MKSISVNKIFLTLTTFFLLSCHQKTETEFIIGNWKYIHIQKNGKDIIEIMDNDHLNVKSDSTFEYNIESVKKQMKGNWTYSDHTLHLHYSSPDTIRHFKMDILSKYELKMHEDSVYFLFRTAQ
jgi:hypothetical protein